MAFIRLPELEIEEEKLLEEKGYWFTRAGYQTSLGWLFKPLNKRARNYMIFLYILPFVVIPAWFITIKLHQFSLSNQYIITGGMLFLLIFPRLIVMFKVFDPGASDYKAMYKGKRDGLYTSGESLYTTKLEGVFLCIECTTPVATTDHKSKVIGHDIFFNQLSDAGLMTITEDSRIQCTVCNTELGKKSEQDYIIDGEKLALDADKVHYIYQ